MGQKHIGISVCLPMGASSGELGERKITQGHEEILEDDGHVHYLDSGDHFMTVSTCLSNFLKLFQS